MEVDLQDKLVKHRDMGQQHLQGKGQPLQGIQREEARFLQGIPAARQGILVVLLGSLVEPQGSLAGPDTLVVQDARDVPPEIK